MSTIAQSCGPIHESRDRGRVRRTQSSLVGQLSEAWTQRAHCLGAPAVVEVLAPNLEVHLAADDDCALAGRQ
jgi:hypothetical protein